MTQLATNAAIQRFGENEERVDKFVNQNGNYATNETTPRNVETLPSFMQRMTDRYITLQVKGNWVTSTAYLKNDLVEESSIVYICIEDHSSTVFATDLSGGKWAIYQGLTLPFLQSSEAGKGSDSVGFKDLIAPTYLKTVSDILNGDSVSLFRFIPVAQHSAIRARTSSYDVSPKLTEAFAALSTAGGGKLEAGFGRFVLASPSTLSENVSMQGEGKGTHFGINGNFDGFVLAGSVGSPKSSLGFKNMRIQRESGSGHPLILTLVDDAELENLIIDGVGYIKLNGTKNAKVSKSNFINGGSLILWSHNETTGGVWGEDNIISKCWQKNASQGFDIIYQRNAKLSKCTSIASTGTYGCGFVIEYEVDGVLLDNCVSYGHVRSGFYIEGNIAYGAKNIHLLNCLGYSNGEAGVTCDTNFLDVRINGGAYKNNTGTFAAGTGHGVTAAANSRLTVQNATISSNAKHGVNYVANPHLLNVLNNDIHDNGGYGINLQGTVVASKIKGNNITSNALGKVNGFSFNAGSNEWDEAPFETFSPTFFKSDGSTVITPLSLSVKFNIVGKKVTVIGKLVVTAGALDTATYFTAPATVARTGGSTDNDALSQRGTFKGSSSGMGVIDNRYFVDRLCLVGTSNLDSSVTFEAIFEI